MRWDPEDQAKALAFRLEDGSRCQMCGTSEWEWEENKFAYEPQSHFCRGCYLKDTHQKDGQTLEGTSTVLVPAEQITWEQRERQARHEQQQIADSFHQ